MLFPQTRVIVLLPSNRPDPSPPNPIPIEWNADKENMLWDVIAKSRTADSGGTDWKGLASHLQVPLPYLLYRARLRYEEDLRGLQVVKGAMNSAPEQTVADETIPRPHALRRNSARMSGTSRLASSLRINTPVGIRNRMNSSGRSSALAKPLSSSTLTLQGPQRRIPVRPASPMSSEGSSSEDADKVEESERKLEEQQSLERKLKNLQEAMTSEALGLMRSGSPEQERRDAGRGRSEISSSRISLQENRGDRAPSTTSGSLSTTTSPQGSIPSIPSPSGDSHPHSPVSRHLSPAKSVSPPALSPGRARGHPHMRYAPLVARDASDIGSNHGSSASSFSDISDASLSASALESASLSNVRGNASSRISTFTRSRFASRNNTQG